MSILDRLRRTSQNLQTLQKKVLGSSENALVYARQLLQGNRGPHVASLGAPTNVASTTRGAMPVLLLQGYLANRGSVQLLARRLHARGYTVMTYRMGSMNVADIRDTAALVARKVESIAMQTGIESVDLVGHSMGGLVGLYYVKRLGGFRRVRRLVLLGAPIEGTWSALFGLVTLPFGRASVQLLPSSAFLRELHEGPMPAGVELVTITGERDWFAPLRVGLLSSARQISLPTTHAGLLVEAAVADALDEVLGPGPNPIVDGSRPTP